MSTRLASHVAKHCNHMVSSPMKTITLAVRLANRSQNGNRLSVLSLRCITDSNRSNVGEDPRMFCLLYRFSLEFAIKHMVTHVLHLNSQPVLFKRLIYAQILSAVALTVDKWLANWN